MVRKTVDVLSFNNVIQTSGVPSLVCLNATLPGYNNYNRIGNTTKGIYLRIRANVRYIVQNVVTPPITPNLAPEKIRMAVVYDQSSTGNVPISFYEIFQGQNLSGVLSPVTSAGYPSPICADVFCGINVANEDRFTILFDKMLSLPGSVATFNVMSSNNNPDQSDYSGTLTFPGESSMTHPPTYLDMSTWVPGKSTIGVTPMGSYAISMTWLSGFKIVFPPFYLTISKLFGYFPIRNALALVGWLGALADGTGDLQPDPLYCTDILGTPPDPVNCYNFGSDGNCTLGPQYTDMYTATTIDPIDVSTSSVTVSLPTDGSTLTVTPSATTATGTGAQIFVQGTVKTDMNISPLGISSFAYSNYLNGVSTEDLDFSVDIPLCGLNTTYEDLGPSSPYFIDSGAIYLILQGDVGGQYVMNVSSRYEYVDG